MEEVLHAYPFFFLSAGQVMEEVRQAYPVVTVLCEADPYGVCGRGGVEGWCDVAVEGGG